MVILNAFRKLISVLINCFELIIIADNMKLSAISKLEFEL